MKYYVFYTSCAEDWVHEFDTLDEVKAEINSYKDDNCVTIYDVVRGTSIYYGNNKLEEDE